MILFISIKRDVVDHLSVLKAVDGLGFVYNTKHLNKFLLFNFQLVHYSTI